MKRVVVTGLGVVSPLGNTVDSFWENIKIGKNGISQITKFDTSDYKVKIAAEIKDFDPTIYMEKRDIKKTDPFVQYAISAASQAVKQSGILDSVQSERLGVYIGSGIGGLSSLVSEFEKLFSQGPARISPFVIPFMIANMATGHVSIKFNAKGPTIPVVTACATGTHSIGEAYRTIKHGYADAIIAGGSEACITSMSMAGFINCKALCTNNDIENSSIPFDKRRSGFVMGEGAGILVLEDYAHAVKRGAKIYAEIVGYGNTSDAYHITAPQPDAEGATSCILNTIKESDLKDDEDIYINAHGTSTSLNDKTETLAIKKAFGEDRARKINISSTKSMLGHMLGAAGAVEAIISILSINNNIVPPTISYKEPDEDCDLNYTPNKMKKCNLDIAFSNSLGFGGHNACLAFRKI